MSGRTRSHQAWWTLAMLAIGQALFVGRTFDSLSIAIVASVALSLTALVPRLRDAEPVRDAKAANRHADRGYWITPLWLAVAILSGLLRFQYVGSSEDVFSMLDILAHAVLAGQFAIVAVTVRGRLAMLPLIALTMIATVMGGAAMTNAEQVTVGFCTAVMIAISNWIFSFPATRSEPREASAAQRTLEPIQRRSWVGYRLLTSLVLVVALVVTTVLSDSLGGSMAWLEQQYDTELLESVGDSNLAGLGSPRYVSRATLNSVSDQLDVMPLAVALRVVADSPAGYLRSRVFDTYREGEWFASSLSDNRDAIRVLPRVAEADLPATVLAERPVLKLRDYELEATNGDSRGGRALASFSIQNDPRRGNHIFLSIDTVLLEANGSAVRVNHQDVVVRGMNERKPYIIYAARSLAPRTLPESERAAYLQPPVGPAAIAGVIAKQIFDAADTPRQKAAAVQRYFRTNYRYSLNAVTRPRKVDPIDYFLRVRHPGHCEYFASGAIAVLRSGGVPCRYVCGYVVTEYNDETDRWLARNRDAHAWVEAFDDESGQWFIVEATPGRQWIDRRFRDEDDRLVTNLDGDENGFDDGASWVSRAWASVSLWIRTWDPIEIARAVRLPLLLLVIVGIVLRMVRSRSTAADLDERYRQQIRKVDRRIKRLGWVRARNETLHQFASRIRSSASMDAEWISEIARWYVLVANMRCQGHPPPVLPPRIGAGAANDRRPVD